MTRTLFDFQLPDLLVAERRGRALVEAAPPLPGAAWAALVECGQEGAAALAALRHAGNCGAEIAVFMLGAEADRCSEFSTQLEVLGCMDIPVRLWNPKAGAALAPHARLILGCRPAEPPRGEVLDIAEFDSAGAWEARPAGSEPETLLHASTKTLPEFPCETIRAIDEAAIHEYGLPGICLMENAGIGACAAAREMLGGDGPRGHVLIVAGKGNNGGDGFVVARGLLEAGIPAEVALLGPPEKLRGDAAENCRTLTDAGVAVTNAKADPEAFSSMLSGAALVIDGILGTGLSGEVRGTAREAIDSINNAGKPVMALDIPSGLNGDTGEVLGVAVRAQRTITFAALKPGLSRNAGPECAGEVILADIGAPREILAAGD
jgi:hydroxyethylthiazole kinase-like uncharacterized protein yjeF